MNVAAAERRDPPVRTITQDDAAILNANLPQPRPAETMKSGGSDSNIFLTKGSGIRGGDGLEFCEGGVEEVKRKGGLGRGLDGELFDGQRSRSLGKTVHGEVVDSMILLGEGEGEGLNVMEGKVRFELGLRGLRAREGR